MSDRVKICEMAPRDGLQAMNREGRLQLDKRVQLVETLQRARLPYIEVGSFVNQKWAKSMADTHELLEQIPTYDGELAALVPNEKHYERFKNASGLTTVALFLSATEEYSWKNKRMTIEKDLETSRKIAADALENDYRVRAHLSAAFRDLSGANNPSSEKVVADITLALLEVGCEEVALADTDGRAGPDDIRRVLNHIGEIRGLDGIGVHLHDRYGLGILNAKIAYDLGVRIFDSSVGGIGGNKAIKYAVGNIATAELLYLFRQLNVETGVEMGAVVDAGRIIKDMSDFLGEDGPTCKVLADALNTEPIDLDNTDGTLTINPGNMETGKYYRFSWQGTELLAIKLEDGDVEVYTRSPEEA